MSLQQYSFMCVPDNALAGGGGDTSAGAALGVQCCPDEGGQLKRSVMWVLNADGLLRPMARSLAAPLHRGNLPAATPLVALCWTRAVCCVLWTDWNELERVIAERRPS